MASIRDVAKRANVAACTVSRVLNGTANVAPETRMKIEQAMTELYSERTGKEHVQAEGGDRGDAGSGYPASIFFLACETYRR